MTIAEARFILMTYRMPMTAEQMRKFRFALMMASGNYLRGL